MVIWDQAGPVHKHALGKGKFVLAGQVGTGVGVGQESRMEVVLG